MYNHRLTSDLSLPSRNASILSNLADCSSATYTSTPDDCYGGVARRKTYVDRVRAEKGSENVLLLDAGNYFVGNDVMM